MPWPDESALSRVWPAPKVTLRCLVYGQGSCDPAEPYFRDFEKRVAVAEFLESLGVEARLPETELPAVLPPGSTLELEMDLAADRDFVVAVQPLSTAVGAPTLRLELMDLASSPFLRPRTFIFQPMNAEAWAWREVTARFPPEQVLTYETATYEECTGIRDRLDLVVRQVQRAKDAGEWPPRPARRIRARLRDMAPIARLREVPKG